MDKNDVYAISGRIKNLIARKNIALSPVGVILVNSYTLVLKDLYDFADKLPAPLNEEMNKLLASKESFPEYVISVSEKKMIEDYERENPDLEEGLPDEPV